MYFSQDHAACVVTPNLSGRILDLGVFEAQAV
jgi:hypothetical protein